MNHWKKTQIILIKWNIFREKIPKKIRKKSRENFEKYKIFFTPREMIRKLGICFVNIFLMVKIFQHFAKNAKNNEIQKSIEKKLEHMKNQKCKFFLFFFKVFNIYNYLVNLEIYRSGLVKSGDFNPPESFGPGWKFF